MNIILKFTLVIDVFRELEESVDCFLLFIIFYLIFSFNFLTHYKKRNFTEKERKIKISSYFKTFEFLLFFITFHITCKLLSLNLSSFIIKEKQ